MSQFLKKLWSWTVKKFDLLIAIVLIAAAFYIPFKLYLAAKADNRRLTDNLQATQQPDTEFTTNDGHQASKKQAYQVEPGEIADVFPDVSRSLQNLDIKPGRAESFTEARQTFEADITAPVKDSLPAVGENTRYILGKIERFDPIPIKTFSFRDHWISVTGIISDSARLHITAVDTIFTAIYRGQRRHPALWILSKRKLEVAATNRSPYIKINVIQGGIIKKR